MHQEIYAHSYVMYKTSKQFRVKTYCNSGAQDVNSSNGKRGSNLRIALESYLQLRHIEEKNQVSVHFLLHEDHNYKPGTDEL